MFPFGFFFFFSFFFCGFNLVWVTLILVDQRYNGVIFMGIVQLVSSH